MRLFFLLGKSKMSANPDLERTYLRELFRVSDFDLQKLDQEGHIKNEHIGAGPLTRNEHTLQRLYRKSDPVLD